MDAWKQNLERLEGELSKVLTSAGRKREDLRVVIVTKTQVADIVGELLELGVREIGESYVQEALEKREWLASHSSGYTAAKWHMIGHVQSRKATDVVANFDWVHSLDSLKLAKRMNLAAQARGKRLRVLMQVNLSGEASKFGFAAQSKADWEALMASIGGVLECKYLDLRGLMSIPPFDEEKEVARKIFKRTRELRDYLEASIAGLELPELSMGMSNDFAEAVQEGATMIRVGTAVLGPRTN